MPDEVSPDIDRLFDQEQPVESLDLAEPPVSYIRCKCGEICNISIPTRCKCGDIKSFWKDLDGKIWKLTQMTLGHLNNTIRILAARADKYPAGQRETFEIALDQLYEELGSRDKEIQQATGIHAALKRSLSVA